MNEPTDNAREIALRAQVDAARADAAACRVSCALLARQAVRERARAEALEARLAEIARHAKRAAARTRDEFAFAALGGIALTAAPPRNVVELRP